MMKATAWFCPVLLTLLSATRLVCTAQRGAATGAGGGLAAAAAGSAGYANGYPLDYLDAQSIQAEYSLAKRNKPSLSIVNPLDVLRQRLMLEIARRQMKENTRQVELNRAILKNVGKRMFLEPAQWSNNRFQHQQHEQDRREATLREQLRRAQLQQQHFPSQLWNLGWPQSVDDATYSASSAAASSPSSSLASSRFFDFLQRPETQARQQPAAAQQQQQQQQQLLNDANKSLNAGALRLSLGGGGGVGVPNVKQQANGNEILNETNHENGNRKVLPIGKSATSSDVENDEDSADQDEVLDELNYNLASEQPEDLDSSVDVGNSNGRLPWRILYRMHKNPHYAN